MDVGSKIRDKEMGLTSPKNPTQNANPPPQNLLYLAVGGEGGLQQPWHTNFPLWILTPAHRGKLAMGLLLTFPFYSKENKAKKS